MIKKIIMMMSAAVAIVCVQAATTYTETVDGIEWTYTVTNGKASVGGSSSSTAIPKTTSGAITIPSTLGGYPVANIGDYAFYQCDKLTSMTIPNGVASIGDFAFSDCHILAELMIPKSVVSIGQGAFTRCRGFINVDLPDDLTIIEDSVFYGCSSITNVKMGKRVISIGNNAFRFCNSLVSVDVPDEVVNIGESAFGDCGSITSVKISQYICSMPLFKTFPSDYHTITNIAIRDGVTNIAANAFQGCYNLERITLPRSIINIGEDAFNLCYSLKEVYISDIEGWCSIVFCGADANPLRSAMYINNQIVADLTIPNTVTYIAPYAFCNYRGLNSVIIPNTIANIAEYTFAGCGSLVSVIIPESVTEIGDCAFSGCDGLKEIIIPDSVTEIGDYAFDNCNNVENVIFGNNITKIADSAFLGCNAVKRVTIPQCICSEKFWEIFSFSVETITNVIVSEGVTNIGFNTFRGFSCLESITLPNSLIDIGSLAFSSCGALESIIIPSSVENIGAGAFKYCSGLTNVLFKGNAPSVEFEAFSQIGADCIARVPRNATGFDVDSNGKWQGMTVVYYDLPEESVDDDVSGGDGDDGEIGDADGAGGTNRVVRADGPAALQAAIEAANEGDVILVGPGTYSPIRTNGKKITIKSTDGAANTIIDGGYTNRCATLADDTMGDWWLGDDSEQEQCVPLEPYNTILIGFTLCNGKSSWKGRVEYYEDGSQANVFFPRVVDGGGVFGGNIVNCVISNNVSELVFEKGSIFYEEDEESGEMVEEITEEDYEESQGGGVSCAKLYNCLVTRNRSTGSGSGIDRCYAYNCTIVANASASHEDEDLNDVFDVENSEIYNTIMSVTPYWGGGYAMDVGDVKAENCAIVSETGDALSYNYFDECWNGDGDIYSYDFIVGDIKFVNPSIGDYRLQQGSAAIDAGSSANVQPMNLEYGDLDQNKRIKDIIDIGAYEYGSSPLVVPVYEMSFASGGATDGDAPDVISFKADEEVELPGCGSLVWPKHTFVGWSDGISIYDSGAIYTGESNVVMTAQWSRNELAVPVISAPETFEADSCEVMITCDSAATIHYTLDGADPTAESLVYTEPVVISGTTEIKAIAIRDNYFDSSIASFTVTRGVWTFGEYLNWADQEFETGGNGEWTRDKKVSFDGYALKSGKILRNQKSCLTTTVQGAGTISFMLKVSSEADEETGEPYDGFVLAVDGVDVTELIGGEIDWRRVSFKIVGDGLHNIEWRYEKDKIVDVGEDCAWIDEVAWSPEDPIPDLGVLATASEVAAALEGSADANLAENIKTAVEYAAYRTWALGLAGVTAQEVKDSPNAWLSHALDTDALITAAPKEGDVIIDTLESSSTDGAFEFAVKIDGIAVGDDALEANIRKVFDIEGAEKLVSDGVGELGVGFSSDNVEVNAAAPENGNVKFMVTPKGGGEGSRRPASFFFRVKMK